MNRCFLLIVLWFVSGLAHGQSDLTITTDPGFPTAGIDLDIEIIFENEFVTEAWIDVRVLGSHNAYDTFNATRTGDEQANIFEVTIPASHVQSQGLETIVYYVLDDSQFIFPENGQPLRTPVFTIRMRVDVDFLTPLTYRMIGIPFQFVAEQGEDFGTGTLDQVFGDDFGPYNPARWRVLRWDPRAENYREGDAAVPIVTPGEGFWMITSSGGDFDVEGGVTPGFNRQGSTIEIQPIEVTLQPGWNQIAAPFLIPSMWPGSKADISEPFAFENGVYVPGIQILEPWNGYFIENRHSSEIEIWLDVSDNAPPTNRVPPGTGLTFSERLMNDFGVGDFGLQVTARSGEIVDAHTYLVVGDEGLRLSKPPAMQGGFYVAETGSGRALTVAPSSSPQWSITISGGWPDQRSVSVQLHELGDFPAGMVPEIVNSITGATIAAPDGQFSVRVGGAQRNVTLDITLVGADELSAPEPNERLLAPYPNPVVPGRSSITFDYWGEDASTRVDVFDVLGRHIVTLAEGHSSTPGWQRINWDVTDGMGSPQAAGVYVIRYRSGEIVTTRTVTVVH